MIHINVGCGGGGSWAARFQDKMMRNDTFVFYDGDTIEKKNLDRQAYRMSDIGVNKATALKRLLPESREIIVFPKYFSSQDPFLLKIGRKDFLWSFVDNHPSRREILRAADNTGASVLMCGNETTDAEAFYYTPKWKGTKLDPRVYYPDIESSMRGDPTSPCTGEEQEQANPQLVMANVIAVTFALYLFHFWTAEVELLDESISGHRWPVHHRMTITGPQTYTVEDKLKA